MTAHLWPNTAAGTKTDWIEFTIEDDVDGGDHVQRVKVNVSFMLSRWNCHYSKGTCPGILTTAANTDFGCCQLGVGVEGGEDFIQVRSAIGQLTEEDCDNWRIIQGKHGHGLDMVPPDGPDDDVSFRTSMVDGACIFANRTDGPAGKPGCAFHHLAIRTGVHPSETKPTTCWQIPFDIIETWNDIDKLYDVTVTARNGAGWGSAYYGTDPELAQHPAYWCTETPDAYTADELVYIHSEVELRKAMGNAAYERMVELLQVEELLNQRYPMPGEVTNEGRPMLPLLVRERVSMWVRDGNVDNLRRSTYLKRGSNEL